MNNIIREALWKERVDQWRASGQSQRAFALQQGLPVRQMGYWVRRLRGKPAAQAPLLDQAFLEGPDRRPVRNL